MRQTKKVAVFCSDTLRAMGIQNILSSYFSPIEIANFEEFPLNFAENGGYPPTQNGDIRSLF